MNELEIFIRSLFDGFFFKKKESLKHLIHIPALKGNHLNINVLSQYGLGIQRKDFPDFSMFGHTSAYGSMLFYDPEQDLSIILTLNQAAAVHKAEWLIKKIVYEIKQGAEPI